MMTNINISTAILNLDPFCNTIQRSCSYHWRSSDYFNHKTLYVNNLPVKHQRILEELRKISIENLLPYQRR